MVYFLPTELFAWINLFSFQSIWNRNYSYYSSYQKWGKWGSEPLCHFPKATQLGSDRVRTLVHHNTKPPLVIISTGVQFSSSLSLVPLFATQWTAACQASLSITNSNSNSCPSSQWCHPTTSSSVVPFSSRLQSFPASGSFPMSRFFASGGQSIGVSASSSVLPMNMQDWFPLGLTGWISLQSKGL